jgi:alpha-glucosidase (family GH31 glycosyl hydrolase)
MWGSALVISPVLEQGEVTRRLYLPPGVLYSVHPDRSLYTKEKKQEVIFNETLQILTFSG